jgi:cyanobactin cluster PatC/TenC/TruC protein
MAKTETLWQIGQPGRAGAEFVQAGGWQATFTYTVGTDADPVGAPTVPPLLVVPSRKAKPKRGKKQLFSTNKLNIRFTLDRDYSAQALTLFYDFFGSETDTLTLDGKLLAEIPGIGEGKLKQNQIPLPALAAGEHTLTLTTAGGAGDGAHWIDYFKLDGVVAPTPVLQPTQTMPAKKKKTTQAQPTPEVEAPKSYLPTTQTGLQDYSYWWAYARENAKTTQPNAKDFRRGRIWT